MNNDLILLGHGSGGILSHQLLEELLIPTLSGADLAGRNDAAVLPWQGQRLAFTTDSYVVDPIFFPGGCIGDLAVNGTVNDLAMMGATPLWLSVGMIIEEGFSRRELAAIAAAMREAADRAGVRIVTGDTKVVPRGKADRIFINTSGIGVIGHDREIDGTRARPGDLIIVSGTIGDHGIAVMAAREGLDLETGVKSDCAALNGLVAELLAKRATRCMSSVTPPGAGSPPPSRRSPSSPGVDITLDEAACRSIQGVKGVCAILGLDPLYVANEGKLLAFVSPDRGTELLD